MALVVTIIILLILAGISIGMLSGDNSIINQVGNAKTQTDIAQEKEILEQATVIAMGKSKYGNVEKQYLDPELNKYSEIDSTEEVDDGIQVTFKSNRVYLIDTDGNIEKTLPTIAISTLQEKYGQDVSGYPSQNGVEGWQLFYADKHNKEVFIISKNIVSPVTAIGQYGIPRKSNNSDSNYTLSDFDKAELVYAQNYNSLWLQLATTTYNKTRATAYLCDYNNWNNKYKYGCAKYAVGGPTLEMIIASFKNKQVKDLALEIDVNKDGYSKNITEILPTGIYRISTNPYWLASPSNYGVVGRELLLVDLSANTSDGSSIDSSNYNNTKMIRPLICLPLSSIQLLEDGSLTIINN